MRHMLFLCSLLASSSLYAQDFTALLEQEKNLVKTVQFSTTIDSVVYNVNGNLITNHTLPHLYEMRGDRRSLRFIFREMQLLNGRLYLESFDSTFTAPFQNRLQAKMYKDGILDLAGINGGRFNILNLDFDDEGKVKEFSASLDQNFPSFDQNYTAEVRFHSHLPIVTNPSMILDEELVLPLVEFPGKQYKAIFLHSTEPGSFQYQVDELISVTPKTEEEINLAVAYNKKAKKFIIPSVIKKERDGEYGEYRLKFLNFPADMKPGDLLYLYSMTKIR